MTDQADVRPEIPWLPFLMTKPSLRILFNKKPPYLDVQNGGEKNTWSAMFREKCMAFYYSHIPFRIAQSWRVNHGELIHHGRAWWRIIWNHQANKMASDGKHHGFSCHGLSWSLWSLKNIILPHTMTIFRAILGVPLRHTISTVLVSSRELILAC